MGEGGKEISASMGGFTPLFDCVIQDVGIIGASVFGRIWRYCQGERGVCQASIGRIAQELNMSERTVIRWQSVLCEAGYLEDLTPELRNKPHTYRDTGKVQLEMRLDAVQNGVTESHSDRKSPQNGMTESHPAMTESHSGYDLKSLEETSKRQGKRQKEGGTKVPDPPPKRKAENGNEINKHPAIQAYREAAHMYPPASWRPIIVEVVGEQPDDLQRWARTVLAWIGLGWNPKNAKGMVDFFKRGEVPGENHRGNGKGKATGPPPPAINGWSDCPIPEHTDTS